MLLSLLLHSSSLSSQDYGSDFYAFPIFCLSSDFSSPISSLSVFYIFLFRLEEDALRPGLIGCDDDNFLKRIHCQHRFIACINYPTFCSEFGCGGQVKYM